MINAGRANRVLSAVLLKCFDFIILIPLFIRKGAAHAVPYPN